jgi:outer membrane cobalamin receptor
MRGPSAIALIALCSLPCAWLAARADSAAELSFIVVTATRVAQNSRDLPVSIDRVDANAIQTGQLQVTLSE